MKYIQGLLDEYIEVNGNKITFTLQDGTIPDAGVNGMQVSGMIVALGKIFESLDSDFPCDENKKTIKALQEAFYWQFMRTLDRKKRGVEGKYKK